MTLEVTRRRILSEFQQDRDAHFDGFDVSTATAQEARAINETRPLPDFEEWLTFADAYASKTIEPNVADYIDLMRAEAIFDPRAVFDQVEKERGVDLLLFLIEETDNPLVVSAALRILGSAPVFEARTLDVESLQERARDASPRVRQSLARFLYRNAMAQQDPQAAARHAVEFRTATSATCSREGKRADPVARRVCSSFRAEADQLEGRADALTGDRPTQWRPALIAAAWTCYASYEGPRNAVSTQLEAIDGQWLSDAWDLPDDFTECMDGFMNELPPPPARTLLDLTIQMDARQAGMHPR